MTRIIAVAAQAVRWPIASRGAARGRSERAALLVEVRSDRGVVGLGEAAPLPGMSRDSLDDAERAVTELAARLPCELADCASVWALAERATAAPAARFAIEAALVDALARDTGRSVASLLAEPARDAHVGAAATVPLAAVVDDPDSARAACAAGIRCLKIKLTAMDPLDRAFAIAAAAPSARLRIDANRTWPRNEVSARLAALAQLPVEYVEEPCRDARELLAGELACPIALDESLGELTEAELTVALASPRLAAVVLKPTLLGLSAALALAARARSAGVAVVISHGLEGPIGTAACAELALALGGNHAAGLAAHASLDAWSIHVPQLGTSHLCPAAGPGLGLFDLDLAAAVAQCARASVADDRAAPSDVATVRGAAP